MRDWLYLLGRMPPNKTGEKWFERDAGDARLAHDRRLLAETYPNLKFALNFALCKMVLRGTIILREENSGVPTSVKIKIIFPDNYPFVEPLAMDGGNQFPYIADRHFYRNGACCLWLPLESQWKAEDENTLLNFVDQTAIFFERQLMYDAAGKWTWGERGHGSAGLIEFLEENLEGDSEMIETFLPLILSETFVHNKTKCPCGSRRNYNLCHKQKVEYIRDSIKTFTSR